MKNVLLLAFVFAVTSTGATVRADELKPGKKLSPQELLRQFAAAWDESHWTAKSRRTPGGYMMGDDDRGWQVRMRVMQGLIAHGKSAVPILTKALNSKSIPDRILAAQTLGYLAPHAPVEQLLEVAKSDRDSAVRLYAVDSLGMQGVTETKIDWQQLLKNESNGDVRKHIRYAIERKQQLVKSAVAKKLADFDVKQINTAKVGQPAPDFTLVSADGETVRLEQFRGKQAVVLVFIYGDT